MKTIFTFLLALMSVSTFAISPETLEAIKQNAKTQTDRLDIAGVNISIHSEGEDYHLSSGMKDITLGIPLTEDHYMAMGSITKTLVGTLLAKFVIDGKVKLDNPISEYLTETAGKAVGEITLKELSTHTSGLPRRPKGWWSTENWLSPFAHYTEGMMLNFVTNYKFEEGERGKWAYSNLGVGLLGHILGRVDKTDFETAISNHILTPLGLNEEIFFKVDGAEREIFSSKYNSALEAQPIWWTLGALEAAGVLKARAKDLLEYSKFIIDPSLSPELEAAIKFATETHLDYQDEDMAIKMGLGWILGDIQGEKWISHDGSTAGFESSLFILPESKRSISVTSNTGRQPKCLITPFLGFPCEVPATTLNVDFAEKLIGHYSMVLEEGRTEVFHLFQGKIAGKYFFRLNEQGAASLTYGEEGQLLIADGVAKLYVEETDEGIEMIFEQVIGGELKRAEVKKIR
jgi:D-alanyl-D-alanine-carboxypeptidase/D-alanyl-D-alanine-endopeptidase